MNKHRIDLKVFLNQINTFTTNDRIYQSFDIEAKDISVMLLCLLYHNKLITAKQLSTYLNKYEETSHNKMLNRTENTLERVINTYHSKINDKWYNDYNFTAILLDVCQDKCTDLIIPFEQLLNYLNKGFSRNINWCVDYIAFSLIKPLIKYYDIDRSYPILNCFGFDINYLSYEDADQRYSLGSGYCCSDCDGCYSQYKYNRYKYYYQTDTKKVNEKIKTELIKYKKHLFNPNDKLLYEF